MSDPFLVFPKGFLCKCGCGEEAGPYSTLGFALGHATGLRPKIPLEDRFWAKVIKIDDADSCWLWRGKEAYSARVGCINVDGHSRAAHRVSWELQKGPIPDGLSVCHRCDNPPCVRISHLFLGDSAANTQDCIDKGRFRYRDSKQFQGVNHPKAILTEDQVREIRRSKGEKSAAILAVEYGVSQSTIYSIRSGQNWSHLL